MKIPFVVARRLDQFCAREARRADGIGRASHANMFHLIGQKPAAGRDFSAAEETRGAPAVATQAPLELQMGYFKRLPQEYTGERHVATVGREADGTYRLEERRGAPPASEDSLKSIIRLFLVRAKDGRPDYSRGSRQLS
jgi:hypothetical protein